MATEVAIRTLARASMCHAGGLGSRDYLSRFCKNGLMAKAFEVVSLMDDRGIPIQRDVILCLLQGCAKARDLRAAGRLQALMVAKGFHTLDFLAGRLIHVFASCGSLIDACHAFDDITKPTIHSWNAIILASNTCGDSERALHLFMCMQEHDVDANSITFQGTLKACINLGSIKQGRIFHAYIIEGGLDVDVALKNTLIDMYAKCGGIDEARNTFDRMLVLTVISWGSMISGYVLHGDGQKALSLFQLMQQAKSEPNNTIFSLVLKACSHIEALHEGRLIHHMVIKSGLQSDAVIGNSLVDLYVRCGSLFEGHKVFQSLPHHTEESWGALIAGYGKHGDPNLNSKVLDELQQDGLRLNRVVFLSLLKGCCKMGCIIQGMIIHDRLIRSGLDCDVLVSGSLVDMYSKCGALRDAHKFFDSLHDPTVVMWGSLINGYVMHGHSWRALDLARKMQEEDVDMDRGVYLCVLKACTNVGGAHGGRLVHGMIIETGSETELTISSTLVDFYSKCGVIGEARKVFDSISTPDVVAWSALITGYVQQGDGLAAIAVHKEMQAVDVEPNQVTFASSVRACSSTGLIKEGRLLHSQIIERGLGSNMVVGNTLLDMYIQCGGMDDAHNVFGRLAVRDVFSWSIIIAGCVLYGKHMCAHQYLEEMLRQGLKPDEHVFTHMLVACTQAGDLQEGLVYFRHMSQNIGITPNTEHYGCALDLLGRAGWLDYATDLSLTIPISPSAIMWTSYLTSCRTHGKFLDETMQLNCCESSGCMPVSSLHDETRVKKHFEPVLACSDVQCKKKLEGKDYIITVEEGIINVDSQRKLDNLDETKVQEGSIVEVERLLKEMTGKVSKDNADINSVWHLSQGGSDNEYVGFKDEDSEGMFTVFADSYTFKFQAALNISPYDKESQTCKERLNIISLSSGKTFLNCTKYLSLLFNVLSSIFSSSIGGLKSLDVYTFYHNPLVII